MTAANAWEVRETCPLCHGRPKALLRQVADYFYGVPGRWSIMRCTSCGHCFLSHTLPWEQLPSLHRVENVSGNGVARLGKLASRRWLRFCPGYRALAADVWRHTADLPPGRLLELGCGGGFYLEWMQRHGWSCCGQDVDPGAVEAARIRCHDQTALCCGDMTHLPWQKNSFDVVNSCNVIEHMPEPRQMLQTAFRMLKPGGRLVIQTVNNQARSARRFGRYWPGWDVPRHFHVFNAEGLRLLAQEAGLTVDSADCRPAMIVAGVGRQALEWEARGRDRELNPLHLCYRSGMGKIRWALECLGLQKPTEALTLIARKPHQ